MTKQFLRGVLSCMMACTTVGCAQILGIDDLEPGMKPDAGGAPIDADTIPDSDPQPDGPSEGASDAGGEIVLDFGDGHDGDFTTSVPGEVINTYTVLAVDIAAGESMLVVRDGGIAAAGDRLLVWQTAAPISPPPPPGNQEPFALAMAGVGHYEFVRITDSDAPENTFLVDKPLVNAYQAQGTQVVRVPEYTNLTIAEGTTLSAPLWNGEQGGIIVALVQDTLINKSFVSAVAIGFRGAPGGNITPSGRGEGVFKGDLNTMDPQGNNRVNGGGGGPNFPDTGGGGGGHTDVGGRGGRDVNAAELGGLGGGPLDYNVDTHLAMGGGGGSGYSDGTAGAAGAGGGVILFHAGQITGSGVFDAQGFFGKASAGAADGSGGGGAGGLVVLRAETPIACLEVIVSGGNGGGSLGNASEPRRGPGGGGAPGKAELISPADMNPCKVTRRFGVAGILEATSECYGATPCCGDGSVDGDESCDDGDRDSGDGCDALCQIESP